MTPEDAHAEALRRIRHASETSAEALVSTQVYESGTVPRMTSAYSRWKRGSGGVTPPW